MKRDVYLIGDIHGKFNQLIELLHPIQDSILVCVGDFGIGFEKTFDAEMAILDYINKQMISSGNTFHVIRGNHDDPKYFSKEMEDMDFSQLKFSVYNSFELAGYKTLFVGAAISIDRSGRKEGKAISPIPTDLPNDIFELIITHNAPNFVNHSSHNLYDELGNPVKTDVLNDRKILDDLYERQKKTVKKWFYGHFHNSQFMNLENTHFRCLDELEIIQLQPKS